MTTYGATFEGFSGEAWPASGVGSRARPAPRREAAPKRALASVGFLLDAMRRRRSGRMALWLLVLSFGLSGIGMLAYPFLTDVWAQRVQSTLEQQFSSFTPQQAKAAYQGRTIAPGKALTRMRIRKLGVSAIVVEGTSREALRAGVGHYVNTALPGQPGNVGIAGHRTGYRGYFRHIDRLKEGDIVELETPFETYIYKVIAPFDGHDNPWITHPRDWSVVSPTPEPSLTLTTCDPPYVATNRLIVRAMLVGTKTRS